jgi:hypothetical protein
VRTLQQKRNQTTNLRLLSSREDSNKTSSQDVHNRDHLRDHHRDRYSLMSPRTRQTTRPTHPDSLDPLDPLNPLDPRPHPRELSRLNLGFGPWSRTGHKVCDSMLCQPSPLLCLCLSVCLSVSDKEASVCLSVSVSAPVPIACCIPSLLHLTCFCG